MKINLDYIKINNEARRLKISPLYLIKKKSGYRHCKKKEMDCRFCEYHRMIGEPVVMQCEIIGINATDYFAKVDKDHICNFYEPMKSKRDCNLSHNFKNYIRFEKTKEDLNNV